MEGQLSALKKRQLEIKKELKQMSRKRAKLNAKGSCDLASLLQELGSASLAGCTDLRIDPRLAKHKDRLTLLALFQLSDHCADTVASWVLRHGLGPGKLCSRYVDIDPEVQRSTVAGVEWL